MHPLAVPALSSFEYRIEKLQSKLNIMTRLVGKFSGSYVDPEYQILKMSNRILIMDCSITLDHVFFEVVAQWFL